VRGQRHAPAAIYPQERPGICFAGGWVGLRAGLDRCGKSRTHRDSIPGPSSPYTGHCATSRKVAGSIPDGVIGKFFINKILPAALWPWGWLSL